MLLALTSGESWSNEGAEESLLNELDSYVNSERQLREAEAEDNDEFFQKRNKDYLDAPK